MTCDILLHQRFISLPCSSHFAVIQAVSWEDWWTYDGISGKYLFRKLIYSKIMGLLWPACVQFVPNKQLRLMLFVHNIRTIRKYTSDGVDIFPYHVIFVSLHCANKYRKFKAISRSALCSRRVVLCDSRSSSPHVFVDQI